MNRVRNKNETEISEELRDDSSEKFMPLSWNSILISHLFRLKNRNILFPEEHPVWKLSGASAALKL